MAYEDQTDLMDAMVAWLRKVLDTDQTSHETSKDVLFHATMLADETPSLWEVLFGTERSTRGRYVRADPDRGIERIVKERALLDRWADARLSPNSEAYRVLTEAVCVLVSGYRHRPGYNPAWSPNTP